MLGERRRFQRQSINRTAKFVTDSAALPRDCLITDLTDHGARLFTDTPDVPDSFQLLISGENAMRRECRVVWRLGGEIGVEFYAKEQDQERVKAMQEFQSQVRDVFRQAG